MMASFFRDYTTTYLCYIPLVEAGASPAQCHSHCQLLFWVIIAIASRRDEEEPIIAVTLLPALRGLIRQTARNPPNSRLEIKAMTMICLWPPPNISIIDIPFLHPGGS